MVALAPHVEEAAGCFDPQGLAQVIKLYQLRVGRQDDLGEEMVRCVPRRAARRRRPGMCERIEDRHFRISTVVNRVPPVLRRNALVVRDAYATVKVGSAVDNIRRNGAHANERPHAYLIVCIRQAQLDLQALLNYVTLVRAE